jgi:hypothetical protein
MEFVAWRLFLAVGPAACCHLARSSPIDTAFSYHGRITAYCAASDSATEKKASQILEERSTVPIEFIVLSSCGPNLIVVRSMDSAENKQFGSHVVAGDLCHAASEAIVVSNYSGPSSIPYLMALVRQPILCCCRFQGRPRLCSH